MPIRANFTEGFGVLSFPVPIPRKQAPDAARLKCVASPMKVGGGSR